MKRDNSVTIAKGIAIILMVIGHSGSPDSLSFLSIIRMPLFFFMSGYCFKEAYLYDIKNFMRKRIKGIYIPFVKWALFFLIFHNLFFKIGITSVRLKLRAHGLNG